MDKWGIVIQVISIVVSIVALIFSIYTHYCVRYSEKKRVTIEKYGALQKFLAEVYRYGDEEIQDFVDNKDSADYKALAGCLAEIEFFAIGIENELYDFEIAYKMSHGFIDQMLRDKITYLINMENEGRKEVFYSSTTRLLKRMDEQI